MSFIFDYLCDWLEYGGERADRRCDARIRMELRDKRRIEEIEQREKKRLENKS
jgi:hypothetical protein